MKNIYATSVDIGYKAPRMEQTLAAVRMAQYPDGSQRLQGAVRWSEGIMGGVEWRDLPIVKVDDNGREVL